MEGIMALEDVKIEMRGATIMLSKLQNHLQVEDQNQISTSI